MPVRVAGQMLALLVPLALGSPAAAQSATTLVIEGDVVSDVGAVASIQNLAVNSSGSWIVEVDTDNPDTNVDSALIRGGALLLQEGQALAAPSGATIDTFDAVTLNAIPEPSSFALVGLVAGVGGGISYLRKRWARK